MINHFKACFRILENLLRHLSILFEPKSLCFMYLT